MVELHTPIGVDHIIKPGDPFPDIPERITYVYMDVETTPHFSEAMGAFYPFNGDRMHSFAITWDDNPDTYYFPFRHNSPDRAQNLNPAECLAWLQKVFDVSDAWVNHNVKFDAKFCIVDGVHCHKDMKLVDTMMLAQQIDTERFNHQLKSLCRQWLKLEMADETRIKTYLKSIKSTDYSRIPIKMQGAYAGWDVRGCRELYHYCMKHLRARLESEPNFKALIDNEVALTRVLFNMECRGIKADKIRIAAETITVCNEIMDMQDKLQSITGHAYIDSAQQNGWVFHEFLGIPPLAYKWTRNKGKAVRGNPTYDADALETYKLSVEVRTHPLAAEVIDLISAYRSASLYNSLFLEVFDRMADASGLLHADYKQNLRTGRMAAAKPNLMQNSKRSKKLIVPEPGNALLSSDASQIEFRIITHYSKDKAAIAAYNKDPKTDFHSWVSETMESDRSSGKTMNFAKSFGAGEENVVKQLAANEAIISAVRAEFPDIDEKEFHEVCLRKAKAFIRAYDEKFPGIKAMGTIAKNTAKARGYIRNLFGRRRHLRGSASRKAFNAAVQATAADIAKMCMVEIENDSFFSERGLFIRTVVHDEILLEGPIDQINDPEVHSYLNTILCKDRCGLDVPILWDMGVSRINWYEASKDNASLHTEPYEGDTEC